MRNRIINGGMDIWQRGTSFSATGYTADRWTATVAGTTTFSQETSIVPSGAQYALKWTTSASSSYGQLRQFIEQLNVIPLRGQTVTVSAYVRSGGTFTGNYLFEIGYSTSTDSSSGSFTTISTTTSGTINNSSYTQIKTTFTVPSNAVGLYFGLVPDTVQASGAIVYQSLAQLEPGSTATPFERRSYGAELALCQRYFQKSYLQNTVPGSSSTSGAYMPNYVGSGNQLRGTVLAKVNMRTAPTVSIYNPETGTSGFWCLEGNGATNQAAAFATFVSEYSWLMYSVSHVAGYFYVQYTASAEL
jgi:hypothetical protein